MSDLEIVFWDVQHGHAAYIKTPNGKSIAIDLGTGSNSEGDNFSPLKHLRTKYKVLNLDYVIITHPHLDHISDILEFDALNPTTLLTPRKFDREDIIDKAKESDKPKYEKYFEICDRYTVDVKTTDSNYKGNPDNWGGVVIKTFSPKFTDEKNINNYSIVTALEYAGSKIVIPGDNEPKSWELVKKDSNFMAFIKDSDILLAPHHGRDSGYDIEIMKHINPRLTVISDGRFVDTSATSRYGNITRKWTVHKRTGTDEKRACVTTRSDGVIVIKFGQNSNGNSFIDVRID
ncbi:MAG: MBL fold metallo-hydrolase [Treponema sp.]|nr:MBL fold metallo-hydrolase [Treponema sp.]